MGNQTFLELVPFVGFGFRGKPMGNQTVWGVQDKPRCPEVEWGGVGWVVGVVCMLFLFFLLMDPTELISAIGTHMEALLCQGVICTARL